MLLDARAVTISVLAFGVSMFAGCSSEEIQPKATTVEQPEGKVSIRSRVADAMSALSDEDRRLAEEQKFCVVSESSLLGSMGPPIKLDINGQPVFICCEGCEAQAKRDPDATLEAVARLKAVKATVPGK
ncbi:MAG: hypothetical protein JNL58_13130 [Planctomyces sp.]|nr:hypothetical protein [Planctomyces sp.]